MCACKDYPVNLKEILSLILYTCIFNFRNLSKKYQPKKNSKEEEEYRYVHDPLLGEHALMEEGEKFGLPARIWLVNRRF